MASGEYFAPIAKQAAKDRRETRAGVEPPPEDKPKKMATGPQRKKDQSVVDVEQPEVSADELAAKIRKGRASSAKPESKKKKRSRAMKAPAAARPPPRRWRRSRHRRCRRRYCRRRTSAAKPKKHVSWSPDRRRAAAGPGGAPRPRAGVQGCPRRRSGSRSSRSKAEAVKKAKKKKKSTKRWLVFVMYGSTGRRSELEQIRARPEVVNLRQ